MSIQWNNELYHYGMPRRSGRYKWGSGKNPYHHGQSTSTGKQRRQARKAARIQKKVDRSNRKDDRMERRVIYMRKKLGNRYEEKYNKGLQRTKKNNPLLSNKEVKNVNTNVARKNTLDNYRKYDDSIKYAHEMHRKITSEYGRVKIKALTQDRSYKKSAEYILAKRDYRSQKLYDVLGNTRRTTTNIYADYHAKGLRYDSKKHIWRHNSSKK